MSLADELIADYEEGGDEFVDNDDDSHMEMAVADEAAIEHDRIQNSVRQVAKLSGSKELENIVDQVKEYSKLARRDAVLGPVESDPEYKLIVEANNIMVEIDNEIGVIHKFTRDHYSKRFPELESLVPTSMEYLKTVKASELGNNIMENSKNNEVLQEILTQATIMVVSVTASTTQGTELSREEVDRVMEACNMAIDLMACKMRIFEYVESRMSLIAPNMSLIIGASIAAKLMGVAGGLTNLSKMPACNVMVLGAQKRTLSGFSTAAIMPHTGFIYYSDIVQKTPPDLRKKASRLVAAKCTLAARVDSFHESVDGRVGDNLRGEVEQKLEKLQEPPPHKQIKPLPAPIDEARKKRGGRRARKMKERLGLTGMRKAANRMNFGEIEEDAYQDDLGFSLGAIGKSNSGGIRGPVVDSKTKARISKTLQQKIQKQNQTWGGSTTVKRSVSGTASSVAFTPLQGLEIVNPQAAEKRVQEANQKYFSATSGFLKIKKDGTTTLG
ncbi:hypothetical protein ScPMuIL_004939 [Solemya velum]